MKLFEDELLLEKNRQNYVNMFSAFIETFNAELDSYPDEVFRIEDRATTKKKVGKLVRISITTIIQGINRSDRASWLLLIYRPLIAAEVFQSIISNLHIEWPHGSAVFKIINTYVAKVMALGNTEAQIQRVLGLKRGKSGNFDWSPGDRIGNWTSLRDQLIHYASLEYPPIDQYNVTGRSWETALIDLRSLETKWTQEMGADDRYILISQMTDNIKVLIDFNDGFAWYDLQTGSSRDEGRTMRHCCTDPRTSGTGGTVYSLREMVKRKGKEWLKPVATFMTKDKVLYEMKGFGNAKPDSKYHKYIAKLLESDYVEGIVGGGYSAATNFTLSDLPEAQARTLAKMKPNLIEPDRVLDYFKEGTEDFWEYIKKLTDKGSFLKLVPKLEPDTVKKAYALKPEFLDMYTIERVFGLKSEEMKKWVLGLNRQDEFLRFIQFLQRKGGFEKPSRIYTENDIDYIKTMRPDLLDISDSARLFGPMSEGFQKSLDALEEWEEEESRISISKANALPDEAKALILKRKPEAIRVETYVDMLGTDSKVAMARFEKVADETGIGWENLESFDADYYYLKYESGDTVKDYVGKYGNRTANFCIDVVTGDEDFHNSGDYAEEPDSWEVENWITDADYAKLLDYIKTNMEDEVEEEGVDLDNKRLVIDFALEFIEEFKAAAHMAAMDDASVGAENEVYETLRSALNGGVEHPVSGGLSATVMFHEQPYQDKDAGKKKDISMKTLSKEYSIDSTVWVIFPKKDILKVFNDAYFSDHWIEHGFEDLSEFNGSDEKVINIDEPYHGWSGHDEDAAKESFENRLHDEMSSVWD